MKLSDHNINRQPPEVRRVLMQGKGPPGPRGNFLEKNAVHHGDALQLLSRVEPNSVALSVWSPPYYVGKGYESHLSFESWKSLLRDVISLLFQALKPGGFLVINIADILCFKDPGLPRIQADAVSRKRSPVTREDVLEAMMRRPDYNRYQLAELLGCSEQTIDR